MSNIVIEEWSESVEDKNLSECDLQVRSVKTSAWFSEPEVIKKLYEEVEQHEDSKYTPSSLIDRAIRKHIAYLTDTEIELCGFREHITINKTIPPKGWIDTEEWGNIDISQQYIDEAKYEVKTGELEKSKSIMFSMTQTVENMIDYIINQTDLGYSSVSEFVREAVKKELF